MYRYLLLIERYLFEIRFQYTFILYFSSVLFLNANATIAEHSIEIHPNLEFHFHYQVSKNNTNNTLLLILASEHGLQEADKDLLNFLPAHNIEAWASNLLNSYFLPSTAANLDKIPVQDIQSLIRKLHALTNKNIIIYTSGRGAIPVLRALAAWPDKIAPPYITGLILMHPKLFTKTPEPGLAAQLMAGVEKTNQLIYLIQPLQSPFWWNRNITINGLQQSGSDVFLRPLKGIRNRYYFRPDATKNEQLLATKYPQLIYSAINQLKHYPSKKRLIAKHYQTKKPVATVKTQRKLSLYNGSPIPPPLNLEILKSSNQGYNLRTDKGKVLLVNFWASWCPPCVHEMPSMQALENQLNKKNRNSFKIIAVNMAESKQTINTFLTTKVSINFDILLDTDGLTLKQWKIFAFPTSFIIGKKGKIRYAFYGGLDWLDPDVIHKIQLLIRE